jgi:hypothetical protein
MTSSRWWSAALPADPVAPSRAGHNRTGKRGLSGCRAAPIVVGVRVTVSSEAAEFVRGRGGRLWVWAAHPRMCCSGAPAWMHAATQPPPGPAGFSRVASQPDAGPAGFSQVAGDEVEVWFRDVGGMRPDVLEIGLRGGRRPRVEAYWDGCLMAML